MTARTDTHDHGPGAHGHGHGHHHAHVGQVRQRALWIALGINFAFMLVEVVIGLVTDSLAVLGDAGHMLADVSALALALGAEKISALEGSPRHTFGYRRAPTLGAFGNALTMLVVAGVLIYGAIERLGAPPDIPAGPVLVVGIIGLIVNLASAWYLHREAGDSHNIRGAMLHMMGDALGSLGVIVSAIVLATTGWTPIDPLVTLLIAVLILIATWPLLRESALSLMLVSPSRVDVDEVRAAILAHPEVSCLEDLHVWELDAGYVVLTSTLHVVSEDFEALERTRAALHHELETTWAINHLTLELVPERHRPDHPPRRCIAGP